MATISITVPDTVVTDVQEAFAVKYGWTAAQGTKAAFAKKCIAEYIKSIYQNYKIDQAADQARISAKSQVSNVDIT